MFLARARPLEAQQLISAGNSAPGPGTPPYGRIFKSLHILAYIDADETYRRDIWSRR